MTKETPKKPKKTVAHKTHRKVFDVVRPGKAPASPTSRPVIASQEPPVADDQFVPGAPALRASDPFAKHDLLNGKHKKALAPLSSPAAETPAVPETPVAPTDAVASPASVAAPVTSAPPVAGVPSLPLEATTKPAEPPVAAASRPAPEASATTAPPVSQSKVSSVTTPETSVSPVAAVDPAPPTASVEQVPSPQQVQEPVPTEEGTPAHLALEQTVQTDVPIWEHPETSTQVEPSAPSGHARPQGSSKSIEDLLAETGAPMLENEQAPSLIVSHHDPRSHGWKVLLVFVIVLILTVIAIDLLLDAGVIKTGADLPYTDFL